jgi:hypothetical protein
MLWNQLREVSARRPGSYPINEAEGIQKINPHDADLAGVLAGRVGGAPTPMNVRISAAQVLGRMGRAAVSALPVLLAVKENQIEALISESADVFWRMSRAGSVLTTGVDLFSQGAKEKTKFTLTKYYLGSITRVVQATPHE